MVESTLVARWAALVCVGLVVLTGTSHALRGLPPPEPRGLYAWLLAAAAVGFAWLALKKSTWLPETGPARLPPHVLQFDRKVEAGMTVATDSTATIAVPDKQAIGVVYWAAEPAPQMTLFADAANPNAVFERMTNGGVARVLNGVATMTFRCPRRTRVLGVWMPKSVQYRVVYKDGYMSEVRQFDVAC